MRLKLLLAAAGLSSLLLLEGGARLRSTRLLHQRVSAASSQQTRLPQRILWVWERPEDLRALDPATTGVAVLQETLRLGSSATPVMRQQPVVLPKRVRRIAVVRIETTGAFPAHKTSSVLLEDAVANLDRISRQPEIDALQIDFDARLSERAFYRQLLQDLRQRMPPTLPLDITALVSWCSTDDWISDLPINAATPMFFRMEPDRLRLAVDQSPAYHLREPLCTGTIGVATGEPWPPNTAGKRVFVFADHGWAHDEVTLAAFLRPFQSGPQQP